MVFFQLLIRKKHISSWVDLHHFLFLNCGGGIKVLNSHLNQLMGNMVRCPGCCYAIIRDLQFWERFLWLWNSCAHHQLLCYQQACFLSVVHTVGEIVDWKLLECTDLPCVSGTALCIQKSKVRSKFRPNQEVRFRLQT